MIRDPHVSPGGLVAGPCKAHALGLASATATSGLPLGIDGAELTVLREQLIAASISVIREAIAEAEANAPHVGIWLRGRSPPARSARSPAAFAGPGERSRRS